MLLVYNVHILYCRELECVLCSCYFFFVFERGNLRIGEENVIGSVREF